MHSGLHRTPSIACRCLFFLVARCNCARSSFPYFCALELTATRLCSVKVGLGLTVAATIGDTTAARPSTHLHQHINTTSTPTRFHQGHQTRLTQPSPAAKATPETRSRKKAESHLVGALSGRASLKAHTITLPASHTHSCWAQACSSSNSTARPLDPPLPAIAGCASRSEFLPVNGTRFELPLCIRLPQTIATRQ